MTAAHSTTDLTRIVNAARPAVFWSDKPGAPDPAPSLAGDTTADLCIDCKELAEIKEKQLAG